MAVTLYDTTLRDGSQQEGISLTVGDKLRIVSMLDSLGIDIIEGGWPSSNPKDRSFFVRVRELPLACSKISAFGSTRKASIHVEDDPQVRALIDAETPVVAIVGKSCLQQVKRVLRVRPDENLRMIHDTVRYLVDRGRQVVFDAEHFFDGYRFDPGYAVETAVAAWEAGCATVVLCDTNGGTLPWDVYAIVVALRGMLPVSLGIHAHNDAEMAVANTLAAVRAGVDQVQGTINGYGERCGNANLCSLLPALQLKLRAVDLGGKRLEALRDVAESVGRITHQELPPGLPYVGRSAFTHKGGLHVHALDRWPMSYQHLDPAAVGNQTRVVVSEQSGRTNLKWKLKELGLEAGVSPTRLEKLVGQIKELEKDGYQFEEADASIELLIRRASVDYRPPFRLEGFHVLVRHDTGQRMVADASVRMTVGAQLVHTADDGNGPVNALDRAVRKALLPTYPELAHMILTDYRVRILDGDAGTGARVRVLLTTASGERAWTTVGCGTSIVEASWIALADALEYGLGLARTGAETLVGKEAPCKQTS